MKKFLAKVLSQYLGIINHPEEFSRVTENRSTAVLVTQSSSFIIEALLTSLAAKAGIKKVVRVPGLPVSDSSLSLDTHSINRSSTACVTALSVVCAVNIFRVYLITDAIF